MARIAKRQAAAAVVAVVSGIKVVCASPHTMYKLQVARLATHYIRVLEGAV